MTRSKDLKKQKDFSKEIKYKLKINVVTCGNCGAVILHKIPTTFIKCHSCGLNDDICSFPDLFNSRKGI